MSICSLNAVLMEIFALTSLDSLKISLFGAVAVFYMKFQLDLGQEKPLLPRSYAPEK